MTYVYIGSSSKTVHSHAETYAINIPCTQQACTQDFCSEGLTRPGKQAFQSSQYHIHITKSRCFRLVKYERS